MMTMKTKAHGFTLIELMVVIAVAAILLVVAAPSMYDFILLQRLKSVNAQVVTDLQFARSEAASRNVNVRFRLTSNDEVTCYVLFTGARNACDCTASPVCPATTEQEIRTVQVSRNLKVTVTPPSAFSELQYDASTGAMSVAAVDTMDPLPDRFIIDTSIDTARRLRTEVPFAGRPIVCAPAGSTLPLPACL